MHDPTYKLSGEELPSRVAYARVSLLFSWGDDVRALALREGQSVVVGRSEPATLIIEDRSLSRTHARIAVHDGEVTLEDLDSTNGCAINGTQVRQTILREGDLAQLGTVELHIGACAGSALRPDAQLSHAEFMRRLADELQRARLFGRALSVVVLRAEDDEPEYQAVRNAVRPIDHVCRFAPGLFVVLLVESDTHAASAWAEGLIGGRKRSCAAGLVSYPALACEADELVSRALDAVHTAKPGKVVVATAQAARADAPIIRSPAMRRLYDLVARTARTTLPVLVLGETGSGKELVARAVHERSPRAKAPFKALNCATIPVNLIESILFGYERGAFTGAERQTPGVFEQAQGGTVFLDEIGELASQTQAALLRVLEQRRIVRVGGTHEVEVDVRVVAATHRDLAAMVAARSFREDLMFRLDALSLRVPPLRERTEEIGALAELFLERARLQWGASAQRFSEDALDALVTYGWPGNVRQLRNVIERAAAVCNGEVVELGDLSEQVWAEPVPAPSGTAAGPRNAAGFRSLTDRLRDYEIELIREAMRKAHGNQSQAARILGVPRRTLANKVHAYELFDVLE